MDSRIEEYKLWERDPIFLEELNSNINNEEYLVNRFQKNLKFGTAGLRSVMGCGWNAMNPATVQQATQGVCQYFIDSVGLESMKKNCVVIGFDARHHSRWFAHIASAVFISQGVPVMLGDSYTATPITPFLVKKHSAVCGIQITASHNPAADNGYKLYAGNGVQIIPPVDSEIHSRLLAQATPWPGVWELLDLEKKSLVLPHELVLNPLPQAWEAYKLELATSLGMLSSTLEASALKIVYTAMHGVGHKFVHDFLTSVQGLPSGNLYSVPEQQEPDPDFPTVAYPNPEEKGALDFAMAYADSVGAPLIIANDPDADRFAAVEKIEGKWHMFTGDELGAVFALVMFSRARDQGIPAEQLLMVNSSVSSQFLSRMCSVEGCTYLETLTGFKWIMNTALEAAEKYGLQLCLGYEEAIGYGVSSLVPDKDGISAAAVFVEKACELYQQNSSIWQFLQEGCMKYGFSATFNGYYRCARPASQAAVLEKFRQSGNYSTEVSGFQISRIRDLKACYDSAAEDKQCQLPRVKDDMMTIYFENGARLTLRGSGTEPKFKFYSEMFHPSSAAEAKVLLVDCVEKVMLSLFAGFETEFVRG